MSSPSNLASAILLTTKSYTAFESGIVVLVEFSVITFEISADKLKTIQTNVKNAISLNSGNIDKAKEAVKGCVDDAYDALAARKEIKDIIPGINKLKTIVIFGLIYRYIGPVIVTPLANKLSSKFFNKKGKEEAPKAAK